MTTILASVQQFSAGNQTDDLTLLIARGLPVRRDRFPALAVQHKAQSSGWKSSVSSTCWRNGLPCGAYSRSDGELHGVFAPVNEFCI